MMMARRSSNAPRAPSAATVFWNERWMAKHCLTLGEPDRERRLADVDRKLGLNWTVTDGENYEPDPALTARSNSPKRSPRSTQMSK